MKLTIGDAIETAIDFITDNFEGTLEALATAMRTVTEWLGLLYGLPPPLIAAVAIPLTWYLGGFGLALFTSASMLLINYMELWDATADTLSLMTVALVISIVFGVPLGMLMAERKQVWRVSEPLLDFMQTLHPFVYLIPVVVALGIGGPGAIVATVIYTIALPIRLTHLGIRSVDPESIEAGLAFGGTQWQILWKIKFPLALRSILAGLNQAVLITLSFIVIAALIGAGGLGRNILAGITRLQLGLGFEAGLAVVLIAIVLDRTTRAIATRVTAKFGLPNDGRP